MYRDLGPTGMTVCVSDPAPKSTFLFHTLLNTTHSNALNQLVQTDEMYKGVSVLITLISIVKRLIYPLTHSVLLIQGLGRIVLSLDYC